MLLFSLLPVRNIPPCWPLKYDILHGYMNVLVNIAAARPGEFIVINFRQKLYTLIILIKTCLTEL